MDTDGKMPKALVNIIGGGIGGLTLARCLKHKGIPVTIYERSAQPKSNNYGINLYPSSYKPLLAALNVSEASFKDSVSVDAAVPNLVSSTTTSIFANRGKLEAWLREGVDIKWDHKIQKVETHTPNAYPPRTALIFENQSQVLQSSLTVAADGPHSAVRDSLIPNHDLNVFPYVAFNGKRKYDMATFKSLYPVDQGPTINFHQNDVRLNISINSISPDEAYLSWIYSRPARSAVDVLHKPNRPKESATHIPEELFKEVAALGKTDLPPLFADIFNAERLKGERILHWLMRSSLVPLDDLQTAAKTGVVFIGDAVHAEPILGGEGANRAIEDAVSLSEWIEGKKDVKYWYQDARYETWEGSVKEAERRIGEAHAGEKAQASL